MIHSYPFSFISAGFCVSLDYIRFHQQVKKGCLLGGRWTVLATAKIYMGNKTHSCFYFCTKYKGYGGGVGIRNGFGCDTQRGLGFHLQFLKGGLKKEDCIHVSLM